MAEIYKPDNSPNWYADFTVGRKRHRPSTKTRNKKEARRIADAMERKAREALHFSGGLQEISLRDALDVYIKKHRNNPTNYAETRCKKLLGELIGKDGKPTTEGLDGDMPFHELSSMMLQEYVQDREDDGAAAQTINHELNALSAAYNLVKEDYRVKTGLKFPRLETTDIPRPLTENELKRLLDELDPKKPIQGRSGTEYVPTEGIGHMPTLIEMRQQNHDLVQVLNHTGCRLSELTNVTWDNVADDFSSFTFFRRKTKKKTGGRYFRMEMKTSRLVREIFQRRFETRGNNPYVFSAWERLPDGAWLRAKAPQKSTKAIRLAMANIGINSDENVAEYGRRDVRSLRDTYATRMVRKGVSLGIVKELLGHASIKQTEKYASFAMDDVNDAAIKVLDSVED